MKKQIYPLLLILTLSSCNSLDTQVSNKLTILEGQNRHLEKKLLQEKKQSQILKRKLRKLNKKLQENSLAKKATIKIISDIWDIVMYHLKTWYTALLIIILVWYKWGPTFSLKGIWSRFSPF